MVNCAYKNEQSQCSHKNVHTTNQVVNDKLCGVCPFQSRQINEENLRSSLPIIEAPVIRDEKPGIIEMAGNFISSAAKHIMNGAENVSQEVYDKRMAICNICPNREGTACKICRCNLPRKLRWKSNSCPIYEQDPTKWGPEK